MSSEIKRLKNKKNCLEGRLSKQNFSKDASIVSSIVRITGSQGVLKKYIGNSNLSSSNYFVALAINVDSNDNINSANRAISSLISKVEQQIHEEELKEQEKEKTLG